MPHTEELGGAGVDPAQLRLLAKVARMYHEQQMRQPQIAEELHISQPRVSRLLKQAAEAGIVRTVVTLPAGVHNDLEQGLQRRFGLKDAVVVEAGGSGEIVSALGAAAAGYLDATLRGGDNIGISSWSATLLAAVEAMRPKKQPVVGTVCQIVGGLGEAPVQVQATRLISRLANLTGARPMFMPAPGLVSTPALRRALLKDSAVTDAMASWAELTMVLVGLGGVAPSPLLRESGNAITETEQTELRVLGAVGDVCLRFFDGRGELVRSGFDQRVVGITPAQLLRIDRRIGVAGGASKYRAIQGALLGNWINILITDLDTASRLLAEPAGVLDSDREPT